MRTLIPNALFKVQAIFEQAVTTTRITSARNLIQLSEPFQQSLELQLEHIRTSADAHRTAAHNYKMHRRVHNENLAQLRRLVRDFWQGLRRRCEREGYQEALAIYRVPKQPVSKGTAWIEYSEQLIAGEAHAVSSGYESMANPSIAELMAIQQLTRASWVDLNQSTLLLQQAQTDQRTALLQCQDKLRSLAQRISEALKNQPESKRRAIMRVFGFTVQSAQTAKPEPSTDAQEKLCNEPFTDPQLELSYA